MGIVVVAVVRLVDRLVHLVAGGVEDAFLEPSAVGIGLRAIVRTKMNQALKPVVVAIVLAYDRHVCSVVVSLLVVDVDLAHGAPNTENEISTNRLGWICGKISRSPHVARVFDVGLGGGAEGVELRGDVRPQPGARHGLVAAEGALVVVAGVAHSLDVHLFKLIS